MKSKFVCRLSVCGIDYLWSYCMYFLQLLVVASPGRYAQTFCFHFWIKKLFWFLRILFVFFNMGPHGSQNFKTLLFPQITFESFQTVSEISSQCFSQKYCFGFLKFWVFDFSRFIALLDYVNRVHEIAICPSSVVRRPHNGPQKSMFGIFEILKLKF